jgi:ribose/xylose/arabinose/galactoside ABC-type transport system permease subunit
MVFPISFLADYLINSGMMSVLTVRKVMNSFAYYGAAAALVGLSFIECDITLAVVALCVAVGCYAGAYVGYAVRQLRYITTKNGQCNVTFTIFELSAKRD